MDKQRTAIQTAIDAIQSMIDDSHSPFDDDTKRVLVSINKQMVKLLPLEKEIMANCHDRGIEAGQMEPFEDYYKNVYN